MPSHLIPPYGGTLCELVAPEPRRAELQAASREWPSWDLTPEQLCELELLVSGAYSPLRGFMARADHDAVVAGMRLADGTFWPVPVTLSVPGVLAARLRSGGTLALRDAEGVMLAALAVEEVWQGDPGEDAWCVGGAVEALQMPVHHDFTVLRPTPADLRREFARRGWRRVVAYQTSRAIHRAEHAATLAIAKAHDARLLVHVESGTGSSADFDHFTRVHCCQAAIGRYPQDTAKLALLPYAPRPRGQRDLLLRALIARNFGCTHLLLDASEGSAGETGAATPTADETGVHVLTAEPMVYLEERGSFAAVSTVPVGARSLHMGERELRERLAEGREIPDWFTFPEVVDELRARLPAAPPAGLHGLLHRPLGRGQVDDRQRRCWSSSSRWAAGR